MKKSFLSFLLLFFSIFILSACVSDNGPKYEFVEVGFGNLDQVVSATGYLQPQERVNLAMEIAGKIDEVFVDVGDEVKKGDILVQLADSDVAMQLSQAEAGIRSASAQVKQAEANLQMQNALLSDLKNGTSEENIKVAESAVKTAEEALSDLEIELANTEALNEETLNGVYDTTISTLEKSLTVGRNSLNTLSDLQYSYFNNTTMEAVAITEAKTVAAASLIGAKDAGRWVSKYLNEYCEGTCALVNSLRDAGDYEKVDQALSRLLIALRDLKNAYLLMPADATLSATDKTSVSSQKTALDLEITNLSARQQAISLQKTSNNNTLDLVKSRYNTAENSLESAKANLALILAGSSEEQIAAQEAAVSQAEAAVMIQQALLEQSRAAYDSLLVNLDKYQLKAAFDGVITEQLAKEGEIASAQMDLLSLMTNNTFEVEASIRETDIDKIKLGNKVSLEFDALPGELFEGELIFIDPAENVQQGVIYYDIKISLNENNKNIDRLKSGMTADLNIITASKEKVTYLPMGVISYRGGKAYVDILVDGEMLEEEIETGIESAGFVEVINNLGPGDKVISSVIE